MPPTNRRPPLSRPIHSLSACHLVILTSPPRPNAAKPDSREERIKHADKARGAMIARPRFGAHKVPKENQSMTAAVNQKDQLVLKLAEWKQRLNGKDIHSIDKQIA